MDTSLVFSSSRTDELVGDVDMILAGGGVEAMEEWQDDPIGWAEKYLGVGRHTLVWSLNDGYEDHSWDGTPDPLAALVDAYRKGQDAGVESGTGTGKSFEVAVLILHFAACWRYSRVFTFAPKEEQLELYIWTEIEKLWPRFQVLFPQAQLDRLRIRMIPGSNAWGAWGRAVGVRAGEKVATRAAGMHAEHMMLVFEEMPGVPTPVTTAAQETCTAPHNFILGIGNPDHQQDGLHQWCITPGVRHIRCSALDHPNVVCHDANIVPGAVSRASLDKRARKSGKGPGTRLWDSRVRGICPEESKEALIRYEWCLEAAERGEDPEVRQRYRSMGKPALGVDVARSEDGDKGSIARGEGAVLESVPSFPCPDPVKLGIRVHMEATLIGAHPHNVGVDSVGVGGATVDKLKEFGFYVEAVNAGEKAYQQVDEDVWREKGRPILQEELFANLRAQMWWQMRLDLQYGRIILPYDEELFRDLTAPKWEERGGKIYLEEKAKTVKELGRSPDKGDAAVFWNWVRFRGRVEEERPPVRAFDPEVLAREAREKRRIKEPPSVRKQSDNPLLIERL